jgi:hypothetical protein
MKAREAAEDGDKTVVGVCGKEREEDGSAGMSGGDVVLAGDSSVVTEAAGLNTSTTTARKEIEKTRVSEEEATKSRTSTLDADKS